MKKYFQNLFSHALAATIAGATVLPLALAAPSFAVSPSEVLRHSDTRTISGSCCFSWDESVSVNLGTTPVPLIATWSADFANSGRFLVTISVNGGPCGAVGGPGQVPAFYPTETGYNNINFQWIILPSDGLVPGVNTITLCGGAHPVFNPGGTASLGFRTLAVRKSN